MVKTTISEELVPGPNTDLKLLDVFLMNESVSYPVVVIEIYYSCAKFFHSGTSLSYILGLLKMIEKPTGCNKRMTKGFIEFPLSLVANL